MLHWLLHHYSAIEARDFWLSNYNDISLQQLPQFRPIDTWNIYHRAFDGRTAWRSMIEQLQSGGTNDFRSRNDKSYPPCVAPSSAIRDRESMCVGDPVGSESLAVLTGNTMDPLFGKPRRLPWRPTRDVTTHPRARWNKWRHVLLPVTPLPPGHPRRYRLVLLLLHLLQLYLLYLSFPSPLSVFVVSPFEITARECGPECRTIYSDEETRRNVGTQTLLSEIERVAKESGEVSEIHDIGRKDPTCRLIQFFEII